MKKSYLFLLLTFQFYSCQTSSVNSTKELNGNGYSISYTNNLRLEQNLKNGAEFCLFTEKDSEEDNFIENINLLIQNLESQGIDLNKFVEISENQINQYGKLHESKRMRAGEIEFQVFVFEGFMNGQNLKFLQYDFIKNDKAYVLTYSAKLEDFDKYLVEMETVMKSFKI